MFSCLPSLEIDDRESLKINFQIRRVALRPTAFEKSCLIDHQPIWLVQGFKKYRISQVLQTFSSLRVQDFPSATTGQVANDLRRLAFARVTVRQIN
jgi:hypothetical protein